MSVRTRLSLPQLRALLRSLPGRIAGKHPDPEGYADAFFGEFAHFLFQKIHKEFMVKSRGAADSTGLRWKPLAESTKRRKAARFKDFTNRKTAQLTRAGMTTRAARTRALQLAHRRVPIGIDKGDLVASLKPAPARTPYVPTQQQLFERSGQKITFGTQVKHARYFHAHRRIWPTPTRMHPWTQEAVRAGRDALKKKLERNL